MVEEVSNSSSELSKWYEKFIVILICNEWVPNYLINSDKAQRAISYDTVVDSGKKLRKENFSLESALQPFIEV